MSAAEATNILGIESSCDDTSAAVISNGKILANIVADQNVHMDFGGVVPELASRAHQKNIVPVVDKALRVAGINKHQLSAIGYTRGPGLLGSLLVGSSFAKSMAMALNIPLIEVNHMKAHALALFIDDGKRTTPPPTLPYLCLTVSGGHTQIVLVKSHREMEIIGETLDDAAGEALDKAAKILGLPYPGGPVIDRLAREGNASAFEFPEPKIPGLNYSFSGLKTSFLYFLRENLESNEHFIEQRLNDICASYEARIVSVLLGKLKRAAKEFSISEIAVAGGVSANRGLRAALLAAGEKFGWNVHIPPMQYCTDNAAMIAQAAWYHYEAAETAAMHLGPSPRMKF